MTFLKKKVYVLYSLTYIIVMSMFFYTYTELPFSFMFFINMIALLLLFKILSFVKSFKYIFVYIMVFFLKNILLAYQSVYKDLPMGGDDWSHFDFMAHNILSITKTSKDIFMLTDYDLFTKLVACSYKYITPNNIIIYYIVFLLSLVMIIFFIKGLEIWNISLQTRNLFSLLLFALPIEFIFSITFLREVPIQMFLTIGLYFFSKFISKKDLISFLLSLACFAFVAMMHAGLIGLVLLTPLWLLPVLKDRQMKINIFSVFVTILFIFVLIKSGTLDVLTLKFSNIDSFESLQNATVNAVVRGNTSYVYPTGNFISYLLSIPYRMTMFTLSPFPWQFKSVGLIIAFFIDGTYRFYFFYKTIKNVKSYKFSNFNKKEKNYLIFLYVLWLVSTLILALGTQNTGTAIRHRAKLYPVELTLLAFYNNKLLMERKNE